MSVSPVSWSQPASLPRRGRLLATARRLLLPVSLLANVFLLAHAAGPWLRPHRPGGFPGMVEHFSRSLPPDDAERFRVAMDAQRPLFETGRMNADQARAALSRAIAATPYDPQLTRERMTEWQARLHAMSSRFGDTLLAALPTLSPEGRARLADAADHPPPPGPPRGTPPVDVQPGSLSPPVSVRP